MHCPFNLSCGEYNWIYNKKSVCAQLVFELNTSTQCYLSELKPVFFLPANIDTIYLLFALYVADI